MFERLYGIFSKNLFSIQRSDVTSEFVVVFESIVGLLKLNNFSEDNGQLSPHILKSYDYDYRNFLAIWSDLLEKRDFFKSEIT